MSAEPGTRSAESGAVKNLVCFALKEEAAAFQKLVAGRDDVCILITGIGRANAEKSVRNFLQSKSPHKVFTCGFAGGLDPELKIGDVVFLTSDGKLWEALVGQGARPAYPFSLQRVVTTATEKADLRRKTGLSAVDMESTYIHLICIERKIPCATVRVISDTAKEDLPLDFNKLSKPDLSLDYTKLALAIAKAPGKIPALLRLQKNSKFAAERLAAVLQAVLFPG